MQVSEIQLYQILRDRLGEKEAQTLVEYVEAKIEKGFDVKQDILATKSDISNVRQEISSAKADMIKWMFIFWIGQLGAMIALTKFF